MDKGSSLEMTLSVPSETPAETQLSLWRLSEDFMRASYGFHQTRVGGYENETPFLSLLSRSPLTPLLPAFLLSLLSEAAHNLAPLEAKQMTTPCLSFRNVSQDTAPSFTNDPIPYAVISTEQSNNRTALAGFSLQAGGYRDMLILL